jgi:hypothetical protein
MTPRQGTDRRIADRRATYRGPDRRSDVDRRRAAESIKAPEPREGPGLITFALIAVIGFLLIDAFVWNGYYRHQMLAAASADGVAVRAWSDSIWRSTAV